ncbi:Vegetative incompatibility protein HET-E-1 [Lasiodiplodia hormozganensis]|uniref:Vegetative incompatibility protein HET-E-1 n=1 Tax=Lasiodiplodia hormozganensis TaxID=869390 RepID=A0AA39WG66_9PEZI|nr:Vegetative incompatibility protein HET-E-1 [Lasiodiplodia hormozganensis]
MRLLNCSTLHLETFVDSTVPPYAILSHRWQDGEVLFEDIVSGQASEKSGYKKIEETCLQASRDGFAYVWVDTCCIDKSSSAELSEAINSMYRWYNQAAVCYVYLFDVPDGIDPEQDAVFAQSEWFRRGWTLQELVAPAHLEFFSQGWICLGAKSTLTTVLSRATGIDVHVLTGRTHLGSFAQDSLAST